MKVKNILKDVATKTLFLEGIKCICCDAELQIESRYSICDNCLHALPFITEKVCNKCGEPIKSLANYCTKCKNHIDRNFDIARSVFLYADDIRRAVINMKYYGKKYLARHLSFFLFDKYAQSNFDCDIVIPVPMSAKSYKKRGYNQTELLCKTFRDNGHKVCTDLVEKYRETENQVNLNFADRQQNIVDAFRVKDKSLVKNKNILLVDDIYTTGATASEIAKVLKHSGANKVFVLTLCHEMPENVENN